MVLRRPQELWGHISKILRGTSTRIMGAHHRNTQRFAKSLKKNSLGICNYAKHRLTSARIEAGNVGIGMIRKRARGVRDTDYFKLKIRQLSRPDDKAIFYETR